MALCLSTCTRAKDPCKQVVYCFFVDGAPHRACSMGSVTIPTHTPGILCRSPVSHVEDVTRPVRSSVPCSSLYRCREPLMAEHSSRQRTLPPVCRLGLQGFRGPDPAPGTQRRRVDRIRFTGFEAGVVREGNRSHHTRLTNLLRLWRRKNRGRFSSKTDGFGTRPSPLCSLSWSPPELLQGSSSPFLKDRRSKVRKIGS